MENEVWVRGARVRVRDGWHDAGATGRLVGRLDCLDAWPVRPVWSVDVGGGRRFSAAQGVLELLVDDEPC